MTETVIQNKEIYDFGDNAIQYPFLQSGSDNSFSTLMKNVSSKVEQTQSNFVDKAVKSNTSSINNYVLKGNKTKQQPKTDDNNSKSNTKELTQNNTELNQKAVQTEKKSNSKEKNNTDITTNEIKTKKQVKSLKTNSQNSFAKKPVEKGQKEVKTAENTGNKTSELNNDSLESSPVSFDTVSNSNTQIDTTEENVNIDTQKTETVQEVKILVENILATFDIPVSDNTNDNDNDNDNDNSNDSIELNSIFDSITEENNNDLSTVIKAVDEISSQVDNLDLSYEKKEEVLSSLNKLKNDIPKINNDIQLEKTIKDAQNLLDKIKPLVAENKDETIDTNLIENQELSEIDSEIEKTLSELKELTKVSNDTPKKEEIIQKLDDLISKLETYDKKDESITKTDISISEKLTSVLKDIKEEFIQKDENNIEVIDEKISKVIKNVENIKAETSKNQKNIKIDINTKDLQNENLTKDVQTTNDNYIEKNTNQKPEEIISQLKEFEKTQEYNQLTNDQKEKIKETIKKLEIISTKENKNDNDTLSIKDINTKANKIIANEENKTSDTTKIDRSIEKESKNVDIPLENNEKDFSQNDKKDFSQNEQNENNELTDENITLKTETKEEKTPVKNKFVNELLKKDAVKSENKVQNFDNSKDNDLFEVSDEDNSEIIETDLQEIQETNTNETTKVNTDNNLKLSGNIVQEIKADFLEDIRYSNETSGALSVADEIMKIALNENNSLLNQTSAGTITYDSANKAITIKNIQNIIQQPIKEVNEANILNQINDKLYQLKDSQKLTLVLRPDDLGRLSIELNSNKEGLSANIVVQNEHVRNYIEKNINNLRSQLSQAGVNVNTIQIKTAGDGNTSTYNGNQNREFQQEQQNQNQQNNQQQKQQHKNQEKNQFVDMGNYDLHFTKDFSSVLNKTLSYLN